MTKDEEIEFYKQGLFKLVDFISTNIHPDYGECDALTENGNCSVCTEYFEFAKDIGYRLNWIAKFVETEDGIFAFPDGYLLTGCKIEKIKPVILNDELRLGRGVGIYDTDW